MYGNQQLTGPVSTEVKESTVHIMNRELMDKISAFDAFCQRLESFADRLEPQPHATGQSEAAKAPPIQNDLQGMRFRITGLGERLEWLGQICNRLERIA
jgi:hypothetical protein